jgi:hypothetical protein
VFTAERSMQQITLLFFFVVNELFWRVDLVFSQPHLSPWYSWTSTYPLASAASNAFDKWTGYSCWVLAHNNITLSLAIMLSRLTSVATYDRYFRIHHLVHKWQTEMKEAIARTNTPPRKLRHSTETYLGQVNLQKCTRVVQFLKQTLPNISTYKLQEQEHWAPIVLGDNQTNFIQLLYSNITPVDDMRCPSNWIMSTFLSHLSCIL